MPGTAPLDRMPGRRALAHLLVASVTAGVVAVGADARVAGAAPVVSQSFALAGPAFAGFEAPAAGAAGATSAVEAADGVGRMVTNRIGGYAPDDLVVRFADDALLPAAADVEVRGTVRRETAAEAYASVVVRAAEDVRETAIRLEQDPWGWHLDSRTGWASTKLGTVAPASPAGTTMAFALRARGAVLSAKVWAAGTAEPIAWGLSVSDPALVRPGRAGLVLAPGGTASAGDAVAWDDVSVSALDVAQSAAIRRPKAGPVGSGAAAASSGSWTRSVRRPAASTTTRPAPSTTVRPPTTLAPSTTVRPSTTLAPSTTVRPSTTLAPSTTTSAPQASSTTRAPATTSTTAAPVPATGGRPFAATSFWNTPIPADAPLHAGSAGMVADLQDQVRRHYGAVAINTTQYTPTVWQSPAGAARVNVRWWDCQGVGPSAYSRAIEAQWQGVPIPDEAMPSAGTDGEMVVWDKATDTMWDFWQARKTPTGWEACWGGRITRTSTGQGIFPAPWGASASGLATAGGLILADEIQRGVIDHALALAIPEPSAAGPVWPANRSDGFSTRSTALREGQRLRLDPTLDVTRLGLSPAGVTIARAMQRYGVVLRDKSGAVNLYAENASKWTSNGLDDPWTALFDGRPTWGVLDELPLDRLQVLPDGYGKP